MSKGVLKAMERLANASLTTEEKQTLANRLNHAVWGRRLDALLKRVDARQKGLPRLSMADIVHEVKAVRRSRAARHRP